MQTISSILNNIIIIVGLIVLVKSNMHGDDKGKNDLTRCLSVY